MSFPYPSHEKDEFEAFLGRSYALFLLCDGPKQEDSMKESREILGETAKLR